tara:strand:+ start:1775 stop:3337 length:1563 start_codon:yes stop_codon:yes gene_type:complete
MGITVYPTPTTTSASTTTDTTKYSWGTPNLGVCMQFTSECSNACFCFCCNDTVAEANGANRCLCYNNQWAVHPLGDDCVAVTKGSIYNLVAQVYSIGSDGSLTAMGGTNELFNWMCEFSCCSPSCCYNYCPQVANCCVSHQLCRSEGTDAAGRMYAYLAFFNRQCHEVSGYKECVHTKSFCFNPTNCTWGESTCTYKNGVGANMNIDCAHFALVTNPAKGLVAVRSCYCNCSTQHCYSTRYFVCGVHCLINSYCTGCTTTYCQSLPVYIGRTSSNTFLAMHHCSIISNKQPGYKLTVDFDNCTITRGDCMPGMTMSGCICETSPHSSFPISGSTVDYLVSGINVNNCSSCCYACLTNLYIQKNGSVYSKMEVGSRVTEAGCHPDAQFAQGKAFMEWAFGGRGQHACCCCPHFASTCNNRCQFANFGSKMVNGYQSTCCHYESYDSTAIRGDTDYAPFDVAIGKVCLRKGISDATGCQSNCHRSAVVVGSDWIAQLCENGQATGYQCAKLAIYGVNSSCGS